MRWRRAATGCSSGARGHERVEFNEACDRMVQETIVAGLKERRSVKALRTPERSLP